MTRAWILALEFPSRFAYPGGVWQDVDPARQERQFVTLVLFGIALILLIWLVARVQARMNRPQTRPRPWHVFGLLLKHHGLGLSDRLLLSAVARNQRIKQPTVLLLSPGLFSRYGTQWLAESYGARLWPDAKGRLARIAQRVFTEDVPGREEQA